MGETSPYEEDVFAWSEQQAAALRRLAGRRDLPNELDLAHVAEEIEDVGISQLNAVRSRVRQILVHAIKCWADSEAARVGHWAAEIGNWHADLVDRMTGSMQSKIDMPLLWRRAVHQAGLTSRPAAMRQPARGFNRIWQTPIVPSRWRICWRSRSTFPIWCSGLKP